MKLSASGFHLLRKTGLAPRFHVFREGNRVLWAPPDWEQRAEPNARRATVSLKGPPRMLHAASNPVPLQCKVDFKCSSLTLEFSQRSAAYPSPRTLEIHAEPPRGPRPLRGVLWFVTDLSFKISCQGGGRWRWKGSGVWD